MSVMLDVSPIQDGALFIGKIEIELKKQNVAGVAESTAHTQLVAGGSMGKAARTGVLDGAEPVGDDKDSAAAGELLERLLRQPGAGAGARARGWEGTSQ